MTIFSLSDDANGWLQAALDKCDQAEKIAKTSSNLVSDSDRIFEATAKAAEYLRTGELEQGDATCEHGGKRYTAAQVAFRILSIEGEIATRPGMPPEIVAKGIASLEQALLFNQGDMDTLELIARAHLRQKNHDSALAATERALLAKTSHTRSLDRRDDILRYRNQDRNFIEITPIKKTMPVAATSDGGSGALFVIGAIIAVIVLAIAGKTGYDATGGYQPSPSYTRQATDTRQRGDFSSDYEGDYSSDYGPDLSTVGCKPGQSYSEREGCFYQ